MDRKIVLILLTVVFIAAAATSPELELVVMAGESQNSAEICIEEDSSDHENTKADNTKVKNKYETEDSEAMAAILPAQGLTLNIDTGFYYVNLPADMKAGWIKIGSTWNYFDTSGRMLI